ncbi:TonB-dependent receptor [Sphingobium yanoikuyae]|uniref:TonB-dependent receptor n=2 Tax=Sphingobium yanoikuyae TaxID=13690 RepID=A0AA43BAM0_SPHYA|nr:TonB-dependent receptor [Sphingobium yanoikuyae]MDH2132328.1 TonB-dependent receptor [Sphingobium yanoikuyae]MDH2150078.1 TonB-dependent receptor [Sphingobium yanoikuyae]
MPFSFKSSVAASAIIAMMVAAPAWSQTDQSAPQDVAAQPNMLPEDIVVTAERRESTVREVPFSIAAFGGELLRESQVFSPAALTQQMPGITVNTADKSLSIVAIRGNVSTFRTATLDTPVAYFMDDVYYVFNNDLNANFFDTQRVEVLRGPQGTLFGRNVVGGAIAVISNNPEMKEDWFGQVTAGNGAYVRTEGMVNGVLVDDKLAFRAAFSTETSNGLIDTPNQKGSYGKTDGVAMRGKLLFQPTDTLKIVLSGDYSYTQGNGGAISLGIGGNQVVPATFGDYDDSKWTNNDFARSPYRQRLRGGYLRGDLDLFGGTLTSITGYRMNDSHATNDDVPVATQVPVFDRRQVVKNRSFTQEVRFASAPGRLSYVVGAYFLSADVSTTNIFYYSPLPGSAVNATVRRNPGVTNITREQEGNVRSLAAFGEATFEVTDGLSLVAGGRYTSDRKKIDYHAFSTTDAGAIPGFGFPGEVFASGGKTWNAFTPRVTVKYRPMQNVNLYATWAKGFKSGGFVDNAYLNPTIPLEPEKAQNYEIGAKTRLFDNMLDFNVALFKQKTKNLQNFSGAGGIAHTYNGTLKMKGVEVESVLRPVDGLRLTGNWTHLVGTYSDLRDPLVNLDYSGNPAKFAPRDSFTVGASYDLAMANGAKITPQADFNYSARISTDDANTLRLYDNLYNDTKGRTLNARLNYESADGRWTVGIWGKNLTNNYQIVNADDITAFLAVPGNGTTYWKIFTNTPRTYGVTLSLRP